MHVKIFYHKNMKKYRKNEYATPKKSIEEGVNDRQTTNISLEYMCQIYKASWTISS